MDIKKVSVVGGGTMGNGITHVFALKGFKVNLVEMSSELVDKAVATITKNLDRQVKKEVITEQDKTAALSNMNKVIGVENTPT